jgi:RNA polymerase sigma-70 factor (ECF subfamily)
MQQYEKMHTSFVKYCKAKAYGILDYQDLVNETITRAYEAYPKLKNQDAFPAFVYSIAKNIIKNELRHRSVKEEAHNKMCSQDLLTQNHAEGRFEIEILYQALSQLPELQKEAIILFEISGYSLKEISAIQESSLSAVKQRLKRGRESLTGILTGQEEKEPELVERRKSPALLTLFF